MKTKKDGILDQISRQAAIDALKVAYWDKDIQSAKDDPCIVDVMTDWSIRQVKALPSAQPEIIHCRDCIQSLFSGLGGDRVYCMKHTHYMYRDDFCSYAVRENNGTS